MYLSDVAWLNLIDEVPIADIEYAVGAALL